MKLDSALKMLLYIPMEIEDQDIKFYSKHSLLEELSWFLIYLQSDNQLHLRTQGRKFSFITAKELPITCQDQR